MAPAAIDPDCTAPLAMCPNPTWPEAMWPERIEACASSLPLKVPERTLNPTPRPCTPPEAIFGDETELAESLPEVTAPLLMCRLRTAPEPSLGAVTPPEAAQSGATISPDSLVA